MPSISYAVTVCNEAEELDRLLEILMKHLREEDEIIIQADTDKITPEVQKIMIKHSNSSQNEFSNVRFHFTSLENDFAQFKNTLKDLCNKDYIFFIDADEYPSDYLLEVLPSLLEANPEVDVYLVPRINTVKGLTQQHIEQWHWYVDEQGRVNYPDFQFRIMINKTEIEWKGKVHEKLVGYKTLSQLPYELDQLALRHPKTIERQEKQNQYYSTL